MKKIFITIGFILISISSCVKKERADILVFAHTGEITSLDPVYSYDGITHSTLLNIYDTLITFNGSKVNEYIPLIASEVPSFKNGLISKDGRKYTFIIRKGIKFHNGDELTSEDVKYSLLRFMIMDIPGGPSSLLLEPIFGITSIRDKDGNIQITEKEFNEAIRVEGDRVIVLLKKPFAPFLSIIARWSYIMDKKWCIENGEWDGKYSTIKDYTNRPKENAKIIDKENGSGPYKVLRWDKQQKQITLTAFENYFRGKAKINIIIEKTIDEFSTRRLMIERGDADIIEVPRIYETQMQNIKGVKIYSDLPRLMTDPVFFFTFEINPQGNTDIGSGKLDGKGIPPDFFKNKDVRKAFAYSFDYDTFIKESLQSKAKRAYSPIPPSVMQLNDIKKYEFDLKKAEEYFKKAFDGKLWENGFELTITYNTGSDIRQTACEILKKNIESINPKFKINIRPLDWALYIEKAQSHKMPIFTRGWVADYADPHNFIFPFFHSKGRYPQAQGFSDKELDNLIEKAISETDISKRKEIYRKIINKANDEVYQIYTIHPSGIIAIRENVENFIDNPLYMGIYFYNLSKSEGL